MSNYHRATMRASHSAVRRRRNIFSRPHHGSRTVGARANGLLIMGKVQFLELAASQRFTNAIRCFKTACETAGWAHPCSQIYVARIDGDVACHDPRRAQLMKAHTTVRGQSSCVAILDGDFFLLSRIPYLGCCCLFGGYGCSFRFGLSLLRRSINID